MSEYANNLLAKRVATLDVSPQFDGYSGVEIIVDDDEAHNIFAGNNTGRVLTIENPWGDATQAANILSAIKGFRYQPYTASRTLLSPAAELGDAVTINGLYSGVYKQSKNFSALMASDIEAPEDEEIDHEYPYESKSDRIYKREMNQTRAQISLTASEIMLEVSALSAATIGDGQNSLKSKLTQTANEINSEVEALSAATIGNGSTSLKSQIQQNSTAINAKVSQTGGNSSSFSWSLTASGFYLKANNATVMKVTSGGLEVSGKITSTSGKIGGFNIGTDKIYNGKSGINDGNNGVYIGTGGIALGKNSVFKVTNDGAVTASNLKITGGEINFSNGTFKVENSGKVTATNLNITGGYIKLGNNFEVSSAGDVKANNMKLTGTLNIGGATISANDLRVGAQQAANNYGSWSNASNTVFANSGGWNGATTTVNANSAKWTTGAAGGIAFENMNDRSAGSRHIINASILLLGGSQAVWTTIAFYDYYQNLRRWTVLAMPQ